MSVPSMQDYQTYFDASFTNIFGRRYKSALVTYNLDTAEPAASILPATLSGSMANMANYGMPTVLLVIQAARGTSATTEVGQVNLMHHMS